MNRRFFLRALSAAACGAPFAVPTAASASAQAAAAGHTVPRAAFALDGNRVRFFGCGSAPLKVMVSSTPTLAGIFAGHIHRPSLDVWHGVPQFVTGANATGAFLNVEFGPMPKHQG